MYAENLARVFALRVRKLGVAITAEERFDMHSDDVITEDVKSVSVNFLKDSLLWEMRIPTFLKPQRTISITAVFFSIDILV